VPKRVAEEFAHDKGGVVSRRFADSRTEKLAGEAAARNRDAAGCVREQNGARRIHLLTRTASPRQDSPDPPRTSYDRKCPD